MMIWSVDSNRQLWYLSIWSELYFHLLLYTSGINIDFKSRINYKLLAPLF